MLDIINGITGEMYGAKARGINMKHPVEIRSMYVRSKTSKDGFSTLSITDEKAGLMLQIEVNEDVKELLKGLTEDKNNGN